MTMEAKETDKIQLENFSTLKAISHSKGIKRRILVYLKKNKK